MSAGPWTSLNLSDRVGDDEDAVRENRARLLSALSPEPLRLIAMRQVHGRTVEVVEDAADVPEADALVTRRPGLALLVQVADCTPLLMWDRRAGVIAAVHVGRKGLASGVVPAALAAMAGLGARSDRTYAVVGPGICPEHYEVPADMRADVDAAVPGTAATTRAGAPALDIRAGVLAQLADARLRSRVVLPHCTAEADNLYSYRRDGVTGRFAGVVWRSG